MSSVQAGTAWSALQLERRHPLGDHPLRAARGHARLAGGIPALKDGEDVK